MRYAVGVPHTRAFEGSFLDSMIGLTQPRDGYHFIRVPDLPVDEARNMIVDRFLAHPDHLQHLLMIDSDMKFAAATLERLAGRLKPGEVDIVSALCFCRYAPIVPSIFRGVTKRTVKWSKTWPWIYVREWLLVQIKETHAWLDAHPEAVVSEPTILDPVPADAMTPADATGAACVLFPRRAFEIVPRPWFKRDAAKRGEDFYFFQRARKAGLKLWVDRSAIVFHNYGDQALGPLDFMADMGVWQIADVHT